MKRISFPYACVLLVGITVALLAACDSDKKPKSDVIIAEKYVPRKPQPPIRRQPSHRTEQVQWGGAMYDIVIDQRPDDSLALVKGDHGQPYVDNRITLTIRRTDGSTFFHHDVTKKTLDACLDNIFRRQGILDGMVYDTISDGHLRFGLQVAFPDADDMFLPIRMLIDRQGNFSVARDTDLY